MVFHRIEICKTEYSKFPNDTVAIIFENGHKINEGDWVFFDIYDKSGAVDKDVRQVIHVAEGSVFGHDGYMLAILSKSHVIFPDTSTGEWCNICNPIQINTKSL